ncbi:hypothetical protein [Shewanella litorisediminis]|uniref:Phage shock protein B n=1 Tax=Shewanella litorisediminis TaxID=1173586 RepID=A0ABX7G7G1_9GAMM|nr:hypothetical protein [Shewanella litorisediminis]MCL2919755.1 hypothetical protein [Shewanella litorisediminis]QRH03302.1 hypothetical protein JQC75_07885 [Shewanella litorisediminis]
MSIPMLALFIPIFAITCGFILQFMRLRERQQRLGNEHKAELTVLHGEINQLKSRIEVLEKLVTDEGFDVRREINRMKGE